MIDGLRLVGGNPDFTNAPGHGDDDARFYDRQQAYVHARGGWLPRLSRRFLKPELYFLFVCTVPRGVFLRGGCALKCAPGLLGGVLESYSQFTCASAVNVGETARLRQPCVRLEA